MRKVIIFFVLVLMFILSSCSKQTYNQKPIEVSKPQQEELAEQEKEKTEKEKQTVDQKKENTEKEEKKAVQEPQKTEPEKEVPDPPRSFLKEANNESIPDDKVYYRGKAVVLTYHHISPKPPTGITITPQRFEADLKMLKENNFNVISYRDMINGMEGMDKLPPNAVVITFDDGYQSFYKYAYPLLLKYNMPAVNFIVTHWTETFTPSGKEFDILTPENIREMYKSGLIDIQSHSHNGHDYIIRNEKGNIGGMLAYQIYDKNSGTYESAETYSKRVVEDLEKSIPVIEKYTGRKSDTFCFPFGHYNSRLIELGKKAGFSYFVTTVHGSNKENSKNNIIYRIRSGDTQLSPEKLKDSIISTGGGKPLPQPKPKMQPVTQ